MSGGNVMSGQVNKEVPKSKYNRIDPRVLNWCAWKVFIPLLFIFLLWPLAHLIKMDYPFQEAFKHGDLLIFSALILIEAAVEGEGIQSSTLWDQISEMASKAFAFFCIFVFAVVKFDVMTQEKNHSLDYEGKLFAYSLFGWTTAIVAVIISIYVFSKAAQDR